jgi:uncharacterized protein with PIN domain
MSHVKLNVGSCKHKIKVISRSKRLGGGFTVALIRTKNISKQASKISYHLTKVVTKINKLLQSIKNKFSLPRCPTCNSILYKITSTYREYLTPHKLYCEKCKTMVEVSM